MNINISINGFGRIGRLVVRALIENNEKNINVVSINDLGGAKLAAHLLQYDTTHSTFPNKVTFGDDWIDFGMGRVAVTAEPNPELLPHKDLNVDVVYECTGRFVDKKSASKHITAGAKKVIISAPAKDADATIVYGVNTDVLTSDMQVISNASCTTNCLAPVAKVLQELVGIESGIMLTAHAYTGDQSLLDGAHTDLRRARAATENIIPSSTGAAQAIGLVIPELDGKLKGSALRVPVQNVSFVEFTFIAEKSITVDEINSVMLTASQRALKGVLDYNDLELVSSDFNHNPHSAIFDATQTSIVGEKLIRVGIWYDNEWGFSNRMHDTAKALMSA